MDWITRFSLYSPLCRWLIFISFHPNPFPKITSTVILGTWCCPTTLLSRKGASDREHNRALSSQPAINPGLLYRASEFTCANRVENVVNRYFYDPLPIPQQFMDTSLTSCMYIAPYLLTSSHFFRRNQSRDRTETPISSSNCFNKWVKYSVVFGGQI